MYRIHLIVGHSGTDVFFSIHKRERKKSRRRNKIMVEIRCVWETLQKIYDDKVEKVQRKHTTLPPLPELPELPGKRTFLCEKNNWRTSNTMIHQIVNSDRKKKKRSPSILDPWEQTTKWTDIPTGLNMSKNTTTSSEQLVCGSQSHGPRSRREIPLQSFVYNHSPWFSF